jgi:hypothetical protein
MMRFLLVPALVCLGSISYAQKTIKVSKGKIKSGDEVIAEYDGKGSAFRMGEYTVTLPGAKDPLITLSEVDHYFNNPLLDEAHYLYQVKFSTGETIYLRPKPNTGKMFGKVYETYTRKFGSDIIEEIFNDINPLVIENKTLSKANIDQVISRISYPYETVMANAKTLEDSIAMYAKEPIARDTKKPVSFQLIPNLSSSGSSWFAIIQDNQVVGRLYKYTDERMPRASYQVWKKAPAGSMLQGKQVEFIPVVITSTLSNNANKQYEAIKVMGKEKIGFTSGNQVAAEYDLVNVVIASGVL